MPIEVALAGFPRAAFDYVWLVRPPPYDERLARGLTPLWRNGSSVLYAVGKRPPPLAVPEDNE